MSYGCLNFFSTSVPTLIFQNLLSQFQIKWQPMPKMRILQIGNSMHYFLRLPKSCKSCKKELGSAAVECTHSIKCVVTQQSNEQQHVSNHGQFKPNFDVNLHIILQIEVLSKQTVKNYAIASPILGQFTKNFN